MRLKNQLSYQMDDQNMTSVKVKFTHMNNTWVKLLKYLISNVYKVYTKVIK